jgi:hypothetical protein
MFFDTNEFIDGRKFTINFVLVKFPLLKLKKKNDNNHNNNNNNNNNFEDVLSIRKLQWLK